MKKEIFAAGLLIAMFAGALYNIHFLRGFIGELTDTLYESRAACESGDFDGAEEHLRAAIDTWNSKEGYTHIFIRHAEIDSTSDAFYELLSDVSSKDASSAVGAYEKVLSHLLSIYTMERITLGSIF